MSLTTEMSPADFGAIMGNGNDGFGGNSAWWIIILFLFAFCGGWGNGFGGNAGASENYVLASDFATLQRQISDSTNSTERKLDGLTNGICELGYTQAQLINNNNISQMQNANTIQSAINTGFCQTNYNGQNNTRDIIDSQNANTRAILDAINANKVEALRDRISEQNQQINALQLSASQQAQNAYLIDQLGTKCPIPAYLTCNPNAPLNYSGCSCNS